MIEQRCIEKGLRMTEQRRVIARVLSQAADHPDAEELHRRAAAIDPNISLATVYRTVKLFEDAGILERHDFRDGRSRYEETSTHHDHLIDVSTGRVIEFVDEEIEKLQRRVAQRLGPGDGREVREAHLDRDRASDLAGGKIPPEEMARIVAARDRLAPQPAKLAVFAQARNAPGGPAVQPALRTSPWGAKLARGPARPT